MISDYLSYNQIQPNYNSHKVYYGSEPIILNFPHSGRIYAKRHLKLIANHKNSLRIFEDPYLDIMLPNFTQCDTSLLINNCARVFIDVNRALQSSAHKPAINGEAMGLIPIAFPCGKHLYKHRLHHHEIETRIQEYYRPYHRQLEILITSVKQKFSQVIMIDCHSMPAHGDKSDPDAFKARPDIIIGDNFGTAAAASIVNTIEQAFIEVGLSVFRNFPYAGGHIINHYGSVKQNIHAIQIEINRRLYLNQETFELTKNAKNIAYQFQYMLQKLKSSLAA